MTPTNTIAAPTTKGFAGISPAAVAEMAVPLAIFAIIVALITPMPGFMLDFLLVIDIMLSVTVLMVSIHLTKPVEFTTLNALLAKLLPERSI